MRNFGFFLALTLTSMALIAADPTGTIVGRVLDPTGAAVVGARITATARAAYVAAKGTYLPV